MAATLGAASSFEARLCRAPQTVCPFRCIGDSPSMRVRGLPGQAGQSLTQGGRVMGDHSEAFVAFDTSKLRNAIAIAEAGRSGEVRFVGEIDNTPAATGKLVKKLAAQYGRLSFCYE